jgi:hypothetical protein
VAVLDTSVINWLSSSNDLKSLLENVLLKFAHIFSAGFNSGLYGGIKISAILWGISSDLAL